MKIKNLFLYILILFFLNATSCKKSDDDSTNTVPKGVSINKKTNYYEVTIDYNNRTAEKIGIEYAEEILKIQPDIRTFFDTYLTEFTSIFSLTMNDYIARINDIKPNIPQKYQNEIKGFISIMANTIQDITGDGKLSANEIYILNLATDIIRTTNCFVIAVTDESSDDQHNIAGRNLEWYSGSNNQLLNYNTVVTIKNQSPEKSIVLIGYLGFLNAITAFNEDGEFAAILDAKTKGDYSSTNKYSYSFDLRESLEQTDSITKIRNQTHDYAFSHIIFTTSPDNEIAAVERSVNNGQQYMIREVDTPLREDINILDSNNEQIFKNWIYPQVLGIVNMFMHNDVPDTDADKNSISYSDSARWNSAISLLSQAGETVSAKEVKSILTYTGEDNTIGQASEGDIYQKTTIQSIFFQPASLKLEILFHQESITHPSTNDFEEIKINF